VSAHRDRRATLELFVFAIRQAKVEDVPTLLKLAKMVHFTNLPADREVIYTKVMHSRESFLRAAGGDEAGVRELREQEARKVNGQLSGLSATTRTGDLFMFVLEDTETGQCLGTSQVIARMGGPGNPNFAWKLEKREFFSQSLQTGTTHIVARLFADESGPTEIGGLILQPATRGQRLGRLVSQVRFHFMGLHRERFSDRTIAEMMAPLTLDGQNYLWEYLGRRFIPLSYSEADKACQYSREFIAALLPKDDIYLSLLPPEARDVIGRVGEETMPARRMLERLGFKYTDKIDPFDGGPHLEAVTDEIPVVKTTRRMQLAAPANQSQCQERAFVSHLNEDGEFQAIETDVCLERKTVALPKAVMAELKWETGAEVGVTPLSEPKPDAAKKPAGRKVRKVRQ
jgi:arginine N-succinyltransferase